MDKTKKILFMNFGGLGDEILFLPTILSAKKSFQNSHITLALEPRSKGILQLTDTIDEILLADIKKNKYKELFKLLLKIWTKKYDIIISSGSNKLISIFLFLTFIKEKYGYNTGKLSEIILTKAIPLNKNQYAVNMYHDLITPITEIKTDLPEFVITPNPIETNTILIHPGVSKLSIEKGMIKTIPAEQWAEIIIKLSDSGKKVQLIGGPDDEDCIKTIEQIVPKNKFENLYGTTKNLADLAKLISGCEKFLCSDSAPLHIAVGLKTKTYVIFGSTDSNKLIPQNKNVIPIKADCNCPLQPCLWEKRQTTCSTLDCLKIPTEKIISTILNQ